MAGGWISGLRGALGRFGALPLAPTGDAAPTAVSSWQEALEASYQRVVVSLDAYRGGALVAAISLSDGSVDADCRRGTMRTASFTLAPTEELDLEQVRALLAVPGTELRPRRGFRYPDGSVETAALGVYVVDELTYRRGREGATLTATCSDISVRIARNPWTAPFALASGTALGTALAAILTDRYPGTACGFDADSVPETLAVAVFYTEQSGSDPWSDVRKLAADHGYELYMDADGVVQCVRIPDPGSAPLSYTYAPGATAIITDETRVLPLARTYNGVIVTGEGSGLTLPVRGEAWDTDPLSETYCDGPFGRVPLLVTSSVATTASAAQSAAEARLAKLRGRVEELSWSQVVNAKLAPLDVVGVTDANGIVSRYVLDQVTTPLAIDGTQTALTRSTTETE